MSRRSLLIGLGAVGAFLAVDLGAVAWANDWIGDRGAALTRQSFIDRFQSIFGVHPGFRRNHAKGVAVRGRFESSGAGSELCTAEVLRAGTYPVVGRFSIGGGNPVAPDAAGTPRGLGLAIGFPGRHQWRTAMLNLPVFPVNSPRGFFDQLLASKADPATGKPDPTAMAAFLQSHPETVAANRIIASRLPTSGFANGTYSSLNTFIAVDAAGGRTPIRWSFVPVPAATDDDEGTGAGSRPRDVLFDALVRQLRSAPRQWEMHLVVGTPEDPVDPTLPWPEDRRVVTAGTLILDTVETERAGNARDVNFDPLVLPHGIEPSDDPILSARSAVYAASYRARSGEPKSASAIQVDEVAP